MEKKKLVYILMPLAALFWSGAFIAGKFGIQELSPVLLTFFRFLFASIIMFSLMVRDNNQAWKLEFADLLYIIPLGVIGMVGYHIFFFKALNYTTTIKSSMIAAMNPLVTTLLATLFLKEQLTVKRLATILLAFTGVLLILLDWNLQTLTSFNFNIGDLLMCIAVLCWASYSIIVKIAMDKYSTIFLTTYSFIVCTFFIFPFALREGLLSTLETISLQGWIAIIYMALFPTVLGYWIQQFSIKLLGPSTSSIYINLVPIFSTGLSLIFLNETIKALNLISGFMIILAVYINSKLMDQPLVSMNDN